MLRISQFADAYHTIDDVLSLPFELRQKSRLRTQLDSGVEAGLMLPRGTILRGGDCLRSDDGRIVQIIAKPEKVSCAVSDDVQLLMRAAYHLGNRHVALEVSENGLCYLEDHVLDKMVALLGLRVIHQLKPFEPEAGAYDTHGH